jgi:hypothetical protein
LEIFKPSGDDAVRADQWNMPGITQDMPADVRKNMGFLIHSKDVEGNKKKRLLLYQNIIVLPDIDYAELEDASEIISLENKKITNAKKFLNSQISPDKKAVMLIKGLPDLLFESNNEEIKSCRENFGVYILE